MKIRKGDAPTDAPVDALNEAVLDLAPERAMARMMLDIPYGFARDNGVVMLGEADGRMKVALREGADPITQII